MGKDAGFPSPAPPVLLKHLHGHGIPQLPYHLDGPFLSNFPAKAVFRGFPGLDFTAGKLPLQGYCHEEASLGRQYAAVLFDDSTGDVEVVFAHFKYYNGELSRPGARAERVKKAKFFRKPGDSEKPLSPRVGCSVLFSLYFGWLPLCFQAVIVCNGIISFSIFAIFCLAILRS